MKDSSHRGPGISPGGSFDAGGPQADTVLGPEPRGALSRSENAPRASSQKSTMLFAQWDVTVLFEALKSLSHSVGSASRATSRSRPLLSRCVDDESNFCGRASLAL